MNSSEKSYGGYSTHSLPTRNAEEGAIPKYVEDKVKYFEEEKGYEPEKAWPVAWSIYCKYKKPGAKSCKKDPSEYFKGRGKKASIQRIADAKTDKVFKSVFEPLIKELKDLGHEDISYELSKANFDKVTKMLMDLSNEDRVYFSGLISRHKSVLTSKLLNG